jgi:acetyl-CoA synthetase
METFSGCEWSRCLALLSKGSNSHLAQRVPSTLPTTVSTGTFTRTQTRRPSSTKQMRRRKPVKSAMPSSCGRHAESPTSSKAGVSRRVTPCQSSESSWCLPATWLTWIYSLPMTWQAAAAFLACARIGAVHSAVFAGFSAESLRDRVNDCECKVVITTE